MQLTFFPAVKLKLIGEIIIIGDYFKTTIHHFPKLIQNDLVHIPADSVNRQNIFEGRTKMFTLLCRPRIGLYKVRNRS
jgi:hypothetical protein